ncbi:glycosyltransferase [Cyclobacterium jeungdonense]|uniref:Glycosyltransferase n=1 Tax=Cyclobacterium jeungdonense TaxID=708087 RepID=A0ABT8C8V9_9BACT|nr:glycosyltransferase [Cyclobacterium jeungdonense]MDN3688806.1 glycosyltransferase [Cyclobacterium jeungdonense]
MVSLIGTLCFSILAVYLLGMLFLGRCWNELAKFRIKPANGLPDCTVLVPFRNEEGNLRNLLPNLLMHLPDQLPVVFIDDHSEDKGQELIRKFIASQGLPHWQCVKSNGSGKKAALQSGIGRSSTGLILTTDADVQIISGWVEEMAAAFAVPEVQMVAGPVLSSSAKGIFARFQRIEWASIGLLTGVSYYLKHPLMCSGANLAFRKAAFHAVSGYQGNEHLLTGDDEFLMKKFVRNFGSEAVRYNPSSDSLVLTHPLPHTRAWIAQRSRWASKWNAHKEIGHAMAAAILVLLSLCQVFSLVIPFISFSFIGWTVLYGILKFLTERAVLGKVLQQFGKPGGNGDYFVAGWIFPLMVLITFPRAITGKYTWKGRKN